MDYLVSLWLVLMWKPLCRAIGASTAWLVAKRLFLFSMFLSISYLLLFNLYGIVRYGPSEYFRELKIIWNMDSADFARERERRYARAEKERAAEAKKRHEEKSKR